LFKDEMFDDINRGCFSLSETDWFYFRVSSLIKFNLLFNVCWIYFKFYIILSYEFTTCFGNDFVDTEI